MIERIARGDLVARQKLGLGAGGALYRLVGAKNAGKAFIVGEIHIAVILDAELGNTVVTHMAAQVLHKIGRKLRDMDVKVGRELLAHAGIGVRGRRAAISRVALDNEN